MNNWDRVVPDHRPCQDALLRRLSLITKDLLNQFRIRPDTLQEHEVRAERLLGSVGILDVALARFAGFALRSSERVLALDIVRCQSAHVCSEFAFPSFFGLQ